jgi:LacI family transcriptional regulator, galactose operon repressor
MAVTIYEIAERAGVSSSTVARVLRGETKGASRRSALRKTAIQRLAREMGYQPNWRAQTFSRAKTYAVGLFHTHTAWVHEATMGEVAGAFTIAMRDLGYHVVIVPYDEQGDWHELLKDGRLDGIAVSHYMPADAQQAIAEFRLPCVLLVDKSVPYWPSVYTDDYSGAYLATKHLTDLGHRRIAMYLHDSIRKHFSVEDRHTGYEKAMEEAGLKDLVDFWHVGDEELPNLLVHRQNPPTAVLCYCHVEAMAIYLAAWRLGLRIPEDLSVIGFNDLQMTRYMTPPLTTMGFGTTHIGRVGASLLVRHIESPHSEVERVVINHKLIERSSTAPPRNS